MSMDLLASKFKLSKLTIEAHTEGKRKSPAGFLPSEASFEVMYNPESLSMHYESEFQEISGIGEGSREARFVRSGPKNLNVKLILDGSGVGTFTWDPSYWLMKPVAEQVEKFLGLCFTINGNIHEPNYLRVLWGKGPLQTGFDCRLKSLDVNYTSFDRDGSPLRAELSVVFVEDLEKTRLAAMQRLNSPDLTHRRVVKAGDTLPLLCAQIYGSPEHYLRVAQVNGLDNFRELRPGQELSFPPFDRRSTGAGGVG